MRPRQPLPRLWLMTDERQTDGREGIAPLLRAIARLPRGAGIVFRHHRTPAGVRRAFYEEVRALARRRGLVLVLAGPTRQAVGWRADGAHGRGRHKGAARGLIRTAPVHDARELASAHAARVDLIFVSPLFPTRSHPGTRTLGRVRFGLLAARARVPVAALGGMTERRARGLARFGIHGWAAIDAWSG